MEAVERAHNLLVDVVTEKPIHGAEEDDDDVSYVLSRRTSSSNSLSPGLGNRVSKQYSVEYIKETCS